MNLADIQIAVTPNAVVAHVSGEIDMSNAEALTGAILVAVSNRSLGLVVDVTAVAYMDSAGVNMLADLGRRLGWRGQKLAVVASLESRPGQVLSLAGADRLLTIEPTRGVALARVRGEGARPA